NSLTTLQIRIGALSLRYFLEEMLNYKNIAYRSIPVRRIFGDLTRKSPLGMIRGVKSSTK
ncbi:hypothetical protein, partial [Cytobacillus firmus]|uniref:hypothetical protein n=1 Tax=Cytobacillus firmus TaxID=1399 RepID=UPI002E1EE1DD|nr:hypothetical protein [Cytobacillus firmus]